MNKNSLVSLVIRTEIAELENDIKKIDIEMSALQEQYLDIDNKEYKSSMSFYIEQNKITALGGTKYLLENEIELYNTAFTDEMISDLDYILELHCFHAPKAYTSLIIKARIDIVRFSKSGISIKDYMRDTKAIVKKIKDSTPFLTLQSLRIIPEQPHKILQELIFFLAHGDAERFGYEHEAKKLRFSDMAISAIIDTISDLKIKPRGQKNFNNEYSILVYGDDIDLSQNLK